MRIKTADRPRRNKREVSPERSHRRGRLSRSKQVDNSCIDPQLLRPDEHPYSSRGIDRRAAMSPSSVTDSLSGSSYTSSPIPPSHRLPNPAYHVPSVPAVPAVPYVHSGYRYSQQAGLPQQVTVGAASGSSHPRRSNPYGHFNMNAAASGSIMLDAAYNGGAWFE